MIYSMERRESLNTHRDLQYHTAHKCSYVGELHAFSELWGTPTMLMESLDGQCLALIAAFATPAAAQLVVGCRDERTPSLVLLAQLS